MSTETATLEIVAPEQAQLVAVVQQNALPAEAAQSLQSSFAPFFSEARSVIEQSRGIVVTDASQRLQIKMARECRLALRSIRVKADAARKALKDESLRRGKAIDGFFNIFLHLAQTEESRLEEQENIAARQEADRKAALKIEREAICLPLGINPLLYQLADMSAETFSDLINGQRLANEAKEAARAKAEAERIAKEKADAEERERVRLENERLKKEAAEKEASLKAEREAAAKAAKEAADKAAAEKAVIEAAAKAEREAADKASREAAAKAKAEREAIEAKAAEEKRIAAESARKEREAAEAVAKKERDARAKVEAELKAQRDAAAKIEADRVAAAKKAAAAPVREKVLAFAAALRALNAPDIQHDLRYEIGAEIARVATWVEKKAETL